MGVGEAITALGVFVGLVVWAVRVEGRVNTHDVRHDEHDRRHGEVREDLTYIRKRIDEAINGRHE